MYEFEANAENEEKALQQQLKEGAGCQREIRELERQAQKLEAFNQWQLTQLGLAKTRQVLNARKWEFLAAQRAGTAQGADGAGEDDE